MQRHGNQLIYAPSDLGNFVACEHLTQLDLSAVLGQGTRPNFSNAYVDLIARKGEEHERNFLEALRADGNGITEVGLAANRDFSAAAQATAEAMRAGSKYIYQAFFLLVTGTALRIFWSVSIGPLHWVPGAIKSWIPSSPAIHGPSTRSSSVFIAMRWSKFRKNAPEMAYVVLGTRERFPVRIANVSAYFRRLQYRFREAD